AELEKAVGASNSTSSLNETVDSEEVKKKTAEFEKALEKAAEGRDDAVGAAFVLNGEVEEVDIYPGNKLFAKLYPRLLQSYAVTAIAEPAKGELKTPACSDVARFMAEAKAEKERREKIDESNEMQVREYMEKVRSDSDYEGKSVNKQWLKRKKK
ncbi:MAG: ARPP-1 family domain-containing protein, partial [Planctomycetota bacterium]